MMSVPRIPAALWVLLERGAGQLLGLVIFAIQAPLLGPHAFGVIALIMVFVGFWDAVACATATDALIAIPALERGHLGTMAILATGAALVTGAVIFAGAGWLGRVFHEPEIPAVARALAALPLLQALIVVPIAAAQRNMRFRELALAAIASQIAGGVSGIAVALLGGGVWALAVQVMAQKGILLACLFFITGLGFCRPSLAHARALAVFGLPNGASRIMSWGSGQVPRLLLGWQLGASPLGLFTLATRLNDIVTQSVVLPWLVVARVSLRGLPPGSARLRASVARVAFRVTLVAFPLSLGGAALLPSVIGVWLDARWAGAVTACQLMLLTALPFGTIYLNATVLLALNRQRREAAICTIQSAATVLVVALFARFGIVAVAAALLTTAVAAVAIILPQLRRAAGLGTRHVLLPQAGPAAAAVLMAASVMAAQGPAIALAGARGGLALCLCLGAVLYAVGLLAFVPGASRPSRPWRRLARQALVVRAR